MNNHFRVSQKLGLMFLPDTPIPDDIESWAVSQLHEKSPAIGIKIAKPYPKSKVKEWPTELQPNLLKRDDMFHTYKDNRERQRQKLKGHITEADVRKNQRDNLMQDLDQLKFAHRNSYGQDQLRLRFTTFWANHFRTANIHDNGNHIGHLIEEGILGNLNSDFATLLFKATSHPAMLIYLDNHISSGPNSEHAIYLKSKGRQAGLNDNLGRELLELHTVSPSAKYTEADIRGAAKVLAGWGAEPGKVLNNPGTLAETHQEVMKMGGTLNSWDFFKQRYAEPGTKNVMGKVISDGKRGLRQLTDFLASHEHTINFISFKLAQHFVSDNPSQNDLNHIKNAWKSGNGNLDQIHTAVIERAIASKEPKFQWPMNWLFQVVRLSGAQGFKGWQEEKNESYNNEIMNTREIFFELGQSFWLPGQPNGYSSDKNEWLSGEMFERRIRFATALYSGGFPTQNNEDIMNRIGANDVTRNMVASVKGNKNKFVALMCSPEIMGLENA